MYLSTSKIHDDQLLDLIIKLKNSVCASVDYQTFDLNKLSPEEVQAHKNRMDELFNKHAKKPGDAGFVYDMRQEFQAGDEECSWDDDI